MKLFVKYLEERLECEFDPIMTYSIICGSFWTIPVSMLVVKRLANFGKLGIGGSKLTLGNRDYPCVV